MSGWRNLLTSCITSKATYPDVLKLADAPLQVKTVDGLRIQHICYKTCSHFVSVEQARIRLSFNASCNKSKTAHERPLTLLMRWTMVLLMRQPKVARSSKNARIKLKFNRKLTDVGFVKSTYQLCIVCIFVSNKHASCKTNMPLSTRSIQVA